MGWLWQVKHGAKMQNKLEPAVLRNNKSTGVEVQEILQMMKLDED
jgi:hypothetical protein